MKNVKMYVERRRINLHIEKTFNWGCIEEERFRGYLMESEMAPGTVEEYVRNVRRYYEWVNGNMQVKHIVGKKEAKNSMLAYKEALREAHLAATTINAKVAALNKYLVFKGVDFKIKYLQMQKRVFKDSEKELSKDEYETLVSTARQEGNERLALIMETLGSTGIRVSELKYVTMEALEKPTIEVYMKSKVRVIIIPERMKEKLKEYAHKKHISSGEIFITANGVRLLRNQIWHEMKCVCKKTNIQASKIYPHNIRAMFARLYYEENKDVVRLGDILGHSSINTTRIYLRVSANECKRQIDRLNIVM